jgi:5-methylcytosine-specific restriction endonuclease McrBC regulatory subunit McrC
MKTILKDGRSVRAQSIYDEAHKKLVDSAIELFNNPNVPNENINISLIAKNAGTSVATAYNHFPNNLIDVFGSIFNIGFQKIVNSVITIQTKTASQLGDAVREAFYQFRKLLISGKWIQGEPYVFLSNICEQYAKENSGINFKSLADDIFVLWNGYIYLWMRYNPNFEIWSQFTDEWLLQKMSKIVDKAIILQK